MEMYKTVLIYYGVFMLARVDDVEKLVVMVNSKRSTMPLYHYYGIWFNSSVCRSCPFFIDVEGEILYKGSCANMYSMGYLQ